MTPKSNLLIAICTFIGCFVLLAIRPVPAEAVYNVKSVTGKIVNVSEGEVPGEVVILLRNNNRTFYINRGTQRGINFQVLKNNLLYRQATLNFVKHWTPSDDVSERIPIARLTIAGQTYWQKPTAKFVS